MFRIFHASVFADAEKTRQARVLRAIAIAAMVIVTVFSVVLLVIRSENTPRMLVLILAINAIVLAVLGASRTGYVRPASIVLIATLCVLAFSFAFTAGGVRSP